jgi:hypothetical protein
MKKAMREERFEETDKVAKKLIEAAAKAKSEKSERLRNARLAAQQAAAAPDRDDRGRVSHRP